MKPGDVVKLKAAATILVYPQTQYPVHIELNRLWIDREIEGHYWLRNKSRDRILVKQSDVKLYK